MTDMHTSTGTMERMML